MGRLLLLHKSDFFFFFNIFLWSLSRDSDFVVYVYYFKFISSILIIFSEFWRFSCNFEFKSHNSFFFAM